MATNKQTESDNQQSRQHQALINRIRSIIVQIFENNFQTTNKSKQSANSQNNSDKPQKSSTTTSSNGQFNGKIFEKLYQELYEMIPQDEELSVLLTIESCMEEAAMAAGKIPKAHDPGNDHQPTDKTTRSNTKSESHNLLYKLAGKMEKFMTALVRVNFLCVRLLRRQNLALPNQSGPRISTFTDINPYLIKAGIRSLIQHVIDPNRDLITRHVGILAAITPPSTVLPVPKRKPSRPFSQNDLLLAKFGWILCLVDLVLRYDCVKSKVETDDKQNDLFDSLIVQPIVEQGVTKYAQTLVELLHNKYIQDRKPQEEDWIEYNRCVRSHWKVKLSNRFSYLFRQPPESADWYRQLKLWFILLPDQFYSHFKQCYTKKLDNFFAKLKFRFVHETITGQHLDRIFSHIAIRFNDPSGTAQSNQLIQTMFNLLEGIDQSEGNEKSQINKDEQINELLKQIIARFEEKLRHQREQQQQNKVNTQFMNHVDMVELFANFEHNLSAMLTTSLYDNGKCHQFIREQLFRLVNNDNDQKESGGGGSGGSGGGKSRVLSFSRCLAIYLHHHLSPMHGNDPSDCHKLKQSIRLFRYLKDKSNFETFYRSYLAKRLLAPLAFWLDKERYVIGQLAQEHDLLYTNQLEGMIADLIQSIGCKMNFQLTLNQQQTLNPSSDQSIATPPDLRLNLLTKHYWSPVIQCDNCYQDVVHLLPKSLQDLMNQFKTYYHKTYQKRTIRFCVKQCWAVVEIFLGNSEELKKKNKAKKKNKKKDNKIDKIENESPKTTNSQIDADRKDRIKLLITAPQVLILQMLCLNDEGHVTLGLIKTNLKKIFSDSEIYRALKLLIGHKVLARKEDKAKGGTEGQSFTERDRVIWNGDLQEPLEAVSSQIATIAKQQDLQDPNRCNSILNCTTMKLGSSIEVVSKDFNSLKWNKLSVNSIDDEENNRSCLDAAIVRMVKQCQKIGYRQLIEDVRQQLKQRFKRRCKESFIEQRIQRLIELDYISSEPKREDRPLHDHSTANQNDHESFKPDFIVYNC